jgi:hypothetical protein
MHDKLHILCDKYENNPEVLHKMAEYLDKQFPHALSLYVDRINRKHKLENQSKIYIEKFLNNPDHQYFYISQNDTFISYNGEKYGLIREDSIWHSILTDISKKEHLIPWKHKIKNMTIKRIKEDKSILCTIPESCTIQNVIQHLTPLLFLSKAETKYFLTLVGDNILKKNSGITHFSRIESHEFLTCLNDHTQSILGSHSSPITDIKHKYNNQLYKDCRTLCFNDSVKIGSCWEGFIKSHILDIIAVAVHYSNQFQNASNYIDSKCESPEAIQRITYISKTDADILMTKFQAEWLEPSNNNGEIKWVEMYYLWKSFIRTTCKFPIMPIFMKTLKHKLNIKLNYNEKLDLYSKVTSSKLSYVKIFQKFWTETITEGQDELEISELWSLYLTWTHNNNTEENVINEEKMHFLIEHFAGSSIIGKFVTSVKCNLWNKQAEMGDIINQLKVDYNFCDEDDVSIYQLYKDYCKKILETLNTRTVSKKYFEKYISKIIPSEYIKDNQLLKEYWNNS